jgi:hypothetical protein
MKETSFKGRIEKLQQLLPVRVSLVIALLLAYLELDLRGDQ